jgi:hypothetical protein
LPAAARLSDVTVLPSVRARAKSGALSPTPLPTFAACGAVTVGRGVEVGAGEGVGKGDGVTVAVAVAAGSSRGMSATVPAVSVAEETGSGAPHAPRDSSAADARTRGQDQNVRMDSIIAARPRILGARRPA